MGARKRKQNSRNLFAEKKRAKKANEHVAAERSQPYEEVKRENDNFIAYYQHQQICPASEWDSFLYAIRDNLLTTFRVTGSRGESNALLKIIKGEFFDDYVKGSSELIADAVDAKPPEKPFCIPWYPGGLAWQLELTRKDIRRSEALYRLHNFLIAETSAGGISRQEAVSMIPPILLDVKPHHKVMDMCAAPGSKTAQIIEALHSGAGNELPSGFVVANDIDNNRCYMLVHQAKRLNSPCVLVTNQDSGLMPNLKTTDSAGKRVNLKFDRVLCDVPCSGDGTLRKNPDIWMKWNIGQGNNLHGVQYRILRRGLEMLAVGGRLVYSTCSLNPVENEAVVHRMLKEAAGSVALVNAADLVPGLKYNPGQTKWSLASRDLQFFDNFEDVPEKFHTVIRPQMFPPSVDQLDQFHLDRCMRILPHHQNTGAFFVAVFEKTRLLPFEVKELAKEATEEVIPPPAEPVVVEDSKTPAEATDKSEEVSAAWGPQRKKYRRGGYKEDPFVFFDGSESSDEIWKSVKSFYNLRADFKPECLLTRCLVGKKKNIYFCSPTVRDVVLQNEDQIKIINTGVKSFVRCDNRHMNCAFRLAQEGLESINAFIGVERRVTLEKQDLIELLQNNDPMKPPLIETLSESVKARVADIGAGSCVLHYVEKELALTLVGWRGTTSLRAYIDQNDTIHMLRLLGADLSKYEVNKFKKLAIETEEKDADDEANSEEKEDEVKAEDKEVSNDM